MAPELAATEEVEEALAAQWSLFGGWEKGALRDEDGLLWFETAIPHLPYNGVLRARLGDDASADAAIRRLVDRFQQRGVESMWFVHPTSTPADLGRRLEAQGVKAVERQTGMRLDLETWRGPELPGGVEFREVTTADDLEAYADLAIIYWSIPHDQRQLVRELQRHMGPGRVPGVHYLALIEGRPVGKGYLSLAGPPGVGSIYGMSVLPEARRRGIAAGLTATLCARARQAGCSRVVLGATEMAIGVYSSVGFERCAELRVYGTAALFADPH